MAHHTTSTRPVTEAAEHLRRCGVAGLDAFAVLGSGWREAAAALGGFETSIPLETVPGFSKPSVAGHGGEARLYRIAGRAVLLFLGRTHLYEGLGVDPVVHPVRVAAQLGARVAVLTNGCGSVQPGWGPGSVVLLSDHINLTGTSPLDGAEFIDMSEAYSPRLRAAAHLVDPELYEGVYAQLRGPQYETPAEVRMARAVGADLVGMSTALETISARHAGMEVLGISLVTNTAAGVSPGVLDHAEVLAAGAAAAPRLGTLLRGVLEAS